MSVVAVLLYKEKEPGQVKAWNQNLTINRHLKRAFYIHTKLFPGSGHYVRIGKFKHTT